MALKTAICLYVRNEERDIAEWIIYHSLIGFDSFIVYHNKSDDSTFYVLDRLRRLYSVIIVDWPSEAKFSQLEAYDDCLKNFKGLFDWVAFIDSDEFIVLPQHATISAFLASFPDANSVVLNWALFGSSGHIDFPSDLITASFLQRALDDDQVNFHTKVIVRPDRSIRVVNPHDIEVEFPSVRPDGSLLERVRHGMSETLAGFNIARVNHYFVKSRAHWAAKMLRGYREGFRGDEHFAAHDLNQIEDRLAASLAPKIRALLNSLEELPMRSRESYFPAIAKSDDEKKSEEWKAIPSNITAAMFRPPSSSLEVESDLFDYSFYRDQYPDVARSGIDLFEHYKHCGFKEGRWPCSRARILEKIQKGSIR